MSLIRPILDDRTYEQLRDELVKRIPVHTPEWTDHNESDPGIALLELFAHLGESLLYRFNQIPDATKVEFLRLLGVRPRPARPAQVLLAASTDRPEGVQVLRDAEARAGSVPFQTEGEVYVWPLDCVAAVKTAAAATGGPGADERRTDALARLRLHEATPAQFYGTTVLAPDPTSADARPVDVAATVDRCLWIALLRRRTTDLRHLAGRTLFVGVAFDDRIEEPFALQYLETVAVDAFRSSGLSADPPPMVWQLWNGPDGIRAPGTPAFAPLTVENDTTRGLVTTGIVTLALPSTLPDLGTAPGSGDGFSPPPLVDEKQAELVVAWLRVARPEHPNSMARNDPIHRVRWVGLNAVSATQARTATPELLGTGNGEADQQFPLAQTPVLPGSLRIQVEEIDGWRDWSEVESFARSERGDRHVTVDPATGMVSFGRGRVPQIGERVRALSYRYGGGLAGNVGAGSVRGSLGPGGAVKVTNPLAAAGGADAATLVEALDAIPAEVHRRDRAVTAEDFRDLAMAVTGVARAETLPLLHPDAPLVSAAGVLSVVIFPREDTVSPQTPLPDRGLLSRVAAHLDRRRLVTTELYVVPPTYRKVLVSAGVQVRTGYQVDAVRRWVEQILRQYLGPLPPDGPDGAGWPLGRAVRAAELEAVAVQVEGVEYLHGLRLGVPEPGGGTAEVDLVTLARWEVPALVAVTAVAGAPLPPGSEYGPGATGHEGVLVPLPPDAC